MSWLTSQVWLTEQASPQRLIFSGKGHQIGKIRTSIRDMTRSMRTRPGSDHGGTPFKLAPWAVIAGFMAVYLLMWPSTPPPDRELAVPPLEVCVRWVLSGLDKY